MNLSEILSHCDHTNLSVTATESDIKALIDDGIKYGVASVCIPPSYVAFAKDYAGEELKICTVIGFPNGYSTKAAKVYEAIDACDNGADEIDMVINLGFVKDKKYDLIEKEIAAVRNVSKDKILKVIIETCLLTEEEKVELCKAVSSAGADYIKTSTGFSTGGATPEDITLFKSNISENLKIKAAGGISSLEDAENFIALGADRLGTSRIVKLAKSEIGEGY